MVWQYTWDLFPMGQRNGFSDSPATNDEMDTLVGSLNTLGRQGWEVCGVFPIAKSNAVGIAGHTAQVGVLLKKNSSE
jgi:hypothetical protein